MSEFIADIEQQYEVYCKIAEEYGFIDLNAKKNGFRCTTKSNEFNAGWIAFTGAVAAVRDEQQAKIDRLNSVLDERTKEWLQAIECGTYFENVVKPLKVENEWLKKQLEIQQVLLDISKPKLHKTDMGDCLHFSTTMFHEGKAECFDCGAVVNQARKIIGIKQALRGERD